MTEASVRDNPSGIRVTMRHVRQSRMCASGVRQWFAAHPRDCLTTFCGAGLPVEWFEAQQDGLAQRLAILARAEATRDGR